MRVCLVVSYDGTDYHGWQNQPGVRTIAGEIIAAVKNLTGEDVEVLGTSRTDAGVHALMNHAVFDTISTIPPDRIAPALNTKLPADIRIIRSFPVENDYNPRFVAKKKTYEYTILNGPVPNPTRIRYAFFCPRKLDEERMNKAASLLVGEHDFTSLSSPHSQTNSFVRRVLDCHVKRYGDEIIISITGEGFLYNMVRIIAGTLLDVGLGKKLPSDIPEIIEKKDRALGGATLPPQGLILKEIIYE